MNAGIPDRFNDNYGPTEPDQLRREIFSDETSGMEVYVVDTGQREIYVLAPDEFEAAEAVTALGEGFNYVEWFSDDPADVHEDNDLIVVSYDYTKGL